MFKMACIGAFKIGKSSLKRSKGMGSSEQVVGFEAAIIEAKASAEMGLN